MKTIKVLVSSCGCNQKFATLVEQVVAKNGLDAHVEKVDDWMEIMQYDAMTLPAILVDNQLVTTGQKKETELLTLLQQVL